MPTVALIAGYGASLILFRRNLIETLLTRGHEVVAYAPEPEPPIGWAEVAATYEPWPMRRAGMNPVADARALAYLVRSLRRRAPDVVLSYTIKPVIYGSLAAKAAGVPRIHAMVTGLGYAFGDQGGPRQQLISKIVPPLYRAALSVCDGVFLQNPDDERDLRNAGALPRAAKVTHIAGSGIDLDRFEFQPPNEKGPPRFLFIGRMLTEKGIREFVEAARRVKVDHPEATFVVVGDYDPNPTSVQRAELQSWVDAGTIEYLGQLQDVRPQIEACTALVLPSYREGTPRSVLEAMAMGRPVITTDAPGCRETVVDGENGFLVPVRDAEAVADAIRKLLEHPATIPEMGRRGRALAERKFDVHDVNETIITTMGL